MSTEYRLLSGVAELVDHYGVRGVGLDAILAKAEISKTTFYKYFASKEDAAIASIRFRAKATLEAIEQELISLPESDLKTKLIELFEIWNRHMFQAELHGNLFLKVCSEFPNPHDEMHQASRTFPEAIRARVKVLGVSHGVKNAEKFADQVMIVIQGFTTYKFIHKRDKLTPHVRELLEFVADQFSPTA